MNFIRFVQYAILATAAVLIILYFTVASAGYLVLVKLLGFGNDFSLSEKIAADPSIPTLIALALCCCFGLEALRNRLKSKRISSS